MASKTITGTAPAPSILPSKYVGQAYQFDGNAANYVDLSSNPLYNLAGKQTTISFWAKWNALTNYQAVLMNWSGGSNQFAFQSDTGSLGAYMASATYQIRATALTTGKWYFFTACFDDINHTLEFYNGAVLINKVTGVTALSSVNDTALGRQGAGAATDSFNGDIANLTVHQRILSAAEIKIRYIESLPSIPDIGTPAVHYSMTTEKVSIMDQPGAHVKVNFNGGVIEDVSGASNTVSTVGSPILLESFGGRDSDVLNIHSSSSMDIPRPNLADNDFTIMFKSYSLGHVGADDNTFHAWGTSGSNADFLITLEHSFLNDNMGVFYTTSGSYTAATFVDSGLKAPLNQWNTIIVCRRGPNLYLMVNGQMGTIHNIGSAVIHYTAGVMSFGGYGGNAFNGYLDDLYIHVGKGYLTSAPLDLEDPKSDHILVDSSGNGNEVILDGPTQVEGRKNFVGEITGKALSFDSSGESITVPDPGLPSTTSPRSVSVLAKSSSSVASWKGILGWGAGTNTNSFIVGMYAPRNIAVMGWNSTVLSGVQMTDNEYFHIVATFNGTETSIFINGSHIVTSAHSLSTTSGTDLIIGNGPGGSAANDFIGDIDELKIFDRVLSLEEVKALYYNKTSAALPSDFTKPVTATSSTTQLKIGANLHDIKKDDTAVTLRKRLETDHNVGAGNVNVTGTYPNFSISFVGKFAGRPFPLPVSTVTPALGLSSTVALNQAGAEGGQYDLTLPEDRNGIVTVVRESGGQTFDITNDPDIGLGRENGIIRIQKVTPGDLTYDTLKVIEWRNS